MERKHWELRKLFEAVEREVRRKPANTLPLKKIASYLQGREKPKAEMLDRLALFVGFQDWASFRDALYGDADAETNFDEKGGAGR